MSQRRSAREEAGFRALVETLERRAMMSAAVHGTALIVTGTRGDDEISVALNEDDPSKVDVTENGETTTFDKAGLVRVRVFAGRGDDVVEVGDDLGLKTGLFGQRGDDELFGANGHELLVGGHGDDFLDGGARSDWIMGMQGEDEFVSTDRPHEIRDLTGEDGLIIGIDEAPQDVRDAVTTLLDGQSEFTLIREDDEGLVFELEWEDLSGGPHSAKIRPNGDVVELESEIDVDTLPDAVVQSILDTYPIGAITEAETLEVPGEPLAYEVEVTLRRTIREIIITPAGEILQDEVEGYLDV